MARREITANTDEGPVTAAQERRGEMWTVTSPWGSYQFSGNAAEVRRTMQEHIRVNVDAVARVVDQLPKTRGQKKPASRQPKSIRFLSTLLAATSMGKVR